MSRLDVPCFVLILLLLNSIQCTKIFDASNSNKISKVANQVYKFLLTGINQKIYCSDPLYIKSMVGHLGNVNYVLENVMLKGLKNCKVTNLTCNTDYLEFQYFLKCPKLVIVGYYEINGSISNTPIDAKGVTHINAEHYLIKVNGSYRTFVDYKDYQKHVYLENVAVDSNPEGTVSFKSDVLEGDSLKLDILKNHANQNWISAEELVRKPIIHVLLKKFVKNLSNALQMYSIQDLIPEDNYDFFKHSIIKNKTGVQIQMSSPVAAVTKPPSITLEVPEIKLTPVEPGWTPPKIQIIDEENKKDDQKLSQKNKTFLCD